MPMSPRLLRPRSAASTAFDARAISGLAVWYDAADAGSVTLNGGNVAELRDKSGNGKHMSQSTAANQPAYVAAGQNGRGVIRATGNPQHLRRESGGSVLQEDLSYLGSTTHTIFIAAKANARTFTNYLYWAINPASTSNSRLQLTGPVASTGTYAIDSGGSSAGTGRLNTTVDAGLSPHIIAFRRSGTDYAAWTNGAASGSATNTGANISFTGTYSLFTWVNAAGASGDGATAFYSGDLYEVLHYNRALTRSERQRVLQYLGDKWGIAVSNTTPSPLVSHPEAQDWIDRVYDNGGTVSASTAAAVNTFCESITAAGIRDRFYRLNLFCGNSDGSLNAVRTPLYRGPSLGATQVGSAIDTNAGFVAGDYAESGDSGGLTGASAGAKCLDTGLVLNFSEVAPTGHLSVYRGSGTPTPQRIYIGCVNPAFSQIYQIGNNSSASPQYDGYYGSASVAGGSLVANENALLVISRTSSTAAPLYRNGTVMGNVPGTASGTNSERSVSLFIRNQGSLNGSFPVTIRSYSIGAALTAAQVSSYQTILQAFFAAIGRTYQ